MITVGLVGIGYWGSNYVRVFHEHPECELKWVADLDEEKLTAVGETWPAVETTTDYTEIVEDADVDGICIATPPSTHFDIAVDFLRSGKDIMVEKPFTLDSERAWELADIAADEEQIILVGHIFEYNMAVRKLRSVIADGDLGDIYYLHAERTGLGPIRPDVSALWDLAPHDISTFHYLRGPRIESVRCLGQSFLQDVEDSVFLFLEFADGSSGFVHCSWLHPHKTRQTTVVGDEQMAVFNDTDPERILEVYESAVKREPPVSSPEEHHFTIREGDVTLPYIERTEPLRVQVDAFVDSIRTREHPLTGPEEGARVVEILEAAEESLANGGIVVDC